MFRKRFTNTALVVATAFIAWSCGDVGQSPVSSVDPVQPDAAAQALAQEAPAGMIVFTPRALRSAKSGIVMGSTAVGMDADMMKESRGGDLKVDFKDYVDDGELQVKKAQFKVEKNSIIPVFPSWNESHLVCMTVYSGTSLDDIVIKFWPSGMKFDPGAELKLQLKGDLEGSGLVGYHISDDGKVTKVSTEIEKKRGTTTLKITVPGFSEYSWDDDDGYDTADEDPTRLDGSCWGC